MNGLKTNYVALGRILRKARESAGLTQGALAKKLQCNQGRISCIERGGASRLGIEEFIDYAKALGRDPVELMKAVEEVVTAE